MAIIEDNEPQVESEVVSVDKVEMELISKSELESLRAIAESASSSKLFFIRMKDEDYEKLAKGERIVNVVQEEFRNYILVLGRYNDPMPDDSYWQDLLAEHGKVITEKAE